jgi:hypothetical protein
MDRGAAAGRPAPAAGLVGFPDLRAGRPQRLDPAAHTRYGLRSQLGMEERM